MQNLLSFQLFILKKKTINFTTNFFFQHVNYHGVCHGSYTSTSRLGKASLDTHMFSKGNVSKFRTTVLKTYLKKLEQMVQLVFHEVVNILHEEQSNKFAMSSSCCYGSATSSSRNHL
ncbi:hypothetical protein CY35_11G116300 [Sphagnum magellanicum]|nr:hypothetical protein CY35_11G116300 [Sphagnum magellanicum]